MEGQFNIILPAEYFIRLSAQIGNATDGAVRAPLWSYQLGLEGRWMPTDPRTANGKCAAIGAQGHRSKARSARGRRAVRARGPSTPLR